MSDTTIVDDTLPRAFLQARLDSLVFEQQGIGQEMARLQAMFIQLDGAILVLRELLQ